MKNKLKNDKSKKISKAVVDKIMNNVKSDLAVIRNNLDTIKKKQHDLRNEGNTLVFDKLMEAHSLMSKINEYNYISKTQDIDILINIGVTLLSISISILIAFISVPSLNGNSVPASIVVFFSAILLIALILYRNKLLMALKVTYFESIVKHGERVLDRADKNLDYLNTKAKDIDDETKDTKEKLASVLIKINTLKKKYIRGAVKKST